MTAAYKNHLKKIRKIYSLDDYCEFAFNLCPTEFWTPQSALRGVLDP